MYPMPLRDIVPRAGAAKRFSFRNQPGGSVPVGVKPVMLPKHWFIGLKTETAECLNNLLTGTWNIPRGIDILNPDQPGAVVHPGIKPGSECGEEAPRVKEPRGGRREASPVSGFERLRHREVNYSETAPKRPTA